MAQTSKFAGPVTVLFIVLSIAGLGYFQFIYMPIVNAEIEIPEEWLNIKYVVYHLLNTEVPYS